MRILSTAILTLTAAILTIGSIETYACTNVIVTRGASIDGSNMVSYAADSHQLYGELYFAPAGTWNSGDIRKAFVCNLCSNIYTGGRFSNASFLI